jgi:pyruvate/2-oxoacid:ferredoxin oxidoreductase alpha subunit
MDTSIQDKIDKQKMEKEKPLYPDHVQKVLKGNFAAAEAARLCRAGFIPAYPITPQTTIIEELSDMVASKRMDATYINMDSEHSVFAAAKGAAIAGERVFTATSGQGLFYSHEVLHAIAHFRLPMVVCNVGRPSIPWNIWSDQSDSLSQRDTGWIQIYGESSQEVLDSIIIGYRITEKLNIPVMIVLDAFYQSHTSENMWIPSDKLVDDFLPPKAFVGNEIDTKNPKSFGGLVATDHYDKFNYNFWKDLNKVEGLVEEIGEEFEKQFGRKFASVEAININSKTKMILTTMSTITTTARGVLDAHPEVGILKIRLIRPFPKQSIINALKVISKDCMIVNIDRNYLGATEGALMQEMKRALYGIPYKMCCVYAGLGGRDVSPETIEKIITESFEDPKEIRWIDVE